MKNHGEDVHLVTQCGMAYTKGLQSDSLDQGIAATLKHFVLRVSVIVAKLRSHPRYEKRDPDSYAVPFEAAIREQMLPVSWQLTANGMICLPCFEGTFG